MTRAVILACLTGLMLSSLGAQALAFKCMPTPGDAFGAMSSLAAPCE